MSGVTGGIVDGVAAVVTARLVRRVAALLAAVALLGLTIAAPSAGAADAPDASHAQPSSGGVHAGENPADNTQPQAGLARGVALATTALLAGLAPFAALVWGPVARAVGVGRDAVRPFGLCAWALLFVLATAGAVELSVYAVRASGEPLGPRLLREALLETRVGHVWLARLGLGLLTAFAVTVAARSPRPSRWWAAVGPAALLLLTLTSLSHAAAEGRFLPFFADWLHVVAAALWMGGLLGFAAVLLSGAMAAAPKDRRAELRRRAVRRFSRVATGAVAAMLLTGLYAALLHVPAPAALVETPYGRVLLAKLGLVALLLALGLTNLVTRARVPLGRVVGAELAVAAGVFAATGFLTAAQPADAVWRDAPTGGDGIAELRLEPAGGSGVRGTATFVEITGGVEARLEISGLPNPGATYLAHVHEGACSAHGDAPVGQGHHGIPVGSIEHPLSPVRSGPGGEGASTTLLWGATFDRLFSGGGYVNLHAAGRADATSLACGDLVEARQAR